MKHTFRYILSSVAMLLPALAFSQSQTELPDPPIYDDYNIAGGVGTKKSVGNAETGGLYMLTLETFATGKTEITESTMPADIVLVLDVSGSMNDNMSGTSYYYYSTNQSWTPTLMGTGNSGNTNWYYKDENGGYHQIYRQRNGNWMSGYTYRYRVTINNQDRYLTSTGLQTSASYVGENATVWIGPLYSRGRTRMHALKQAVEAFVNEVNHNALYDKDNKRRATPVSHQISVVKYAYNRYVNANGEVQATSQDPANASGVEVIVPGNYVENDPYGYTDQWNPTQVVVGFTNVSTDAGVKSVLDNNGNGVNHLLPGGATAADFGMTKAWYLLNQNSIKTRESSKVVVLFTDGQPTYGDSFSSTVAGNTIAAAKKLKDDFKATVYTVGVFDNETDNIRKYMNWTSSNYPEAENWSTGGTGSDEGYYQNASNADLTEIFKKIASSASSTVPKIEGTTQVVDVVSNSFEVPSTFTANDVVVYTRSINTAGTEFDDNTKNILTKINLTDVEGFDPTAAPPADAEYMTDENKVGVYLKNGKLIILGFNYSKADSQGADGSTAHPYNGNWVGFRKQNVAAGKELVIEFKIEGNPDATGGDGTNTNKPESGVYVLVDGEYVNVNPYEVPHRNLPINIVIEKSGLRAGESATVQIYRCHQLKNDAGEVQYNTKTGKPLPEKTMPTVGQDPKTLGWENFTKVILTNTTGQDLHPVTKTLLALHADYVYLLVEDNWGWAYILDDSIMSTDEVEINPFRFSNTEDSNAVKHAEAISINHFGNGYTDEERVKTYKSSKTIMTTNSGDSGDSGDSGNSE